MEFKAISTIKDRSASDVIVIPYVKQKEKAVQAVKAADLPSEALVALAAGDFNGKEGETLWVYSSSPRGGRFLLLGLGDEKRVDVEGLRRAYAIQAKGCLARKLKSLSLYLPDKLKLPAKELVRGVVEGMSLVNYSFTGMKSRSKERAARIERVGLIGVGSELVADAKRFASVFEGVYLARDLVNGNADDVTPQHLASFARELAKRHPKLKATVFDKKRLEKEGFGLLLAVSRGAHHDPALLILEYRGDPKSKEHMVFVGKGITYDTGGLNLKPTGSMETMRADMAGAAAVLGACAAATVMGIKKNVTVVVPCAENSIDARSYKPGDVYSGYAGKSVEIGNTDAEGRLVLADALAYAVKKLRPTYLVDIATLTGAIEIALGPEMVGLFSNDDRLAKAIEKAGEITYERAWRMPLIEEYLEQLKSDIADLKNIGGRGGGSIKGALFLQEFVGKIPWAHLDIASAAYAVEPRRYLPKHATGIGVRLLIELLESL